MMEGVTHRCRTRRLPQQTRTVVRVEVMLDSGATLGVIERLFFKSSADVNRKRIRQVIGDGLHGPAVVEVREVAAGMPAGRIGHD